MCGKWKRRRQWAKKRCVCVYACVCVLVWAQTQRGQEWPGSGKNLFKRTPPSVVSSLAHSGILSPWERDQLSLGENMQRSSSVSFHTICISGLNQAPPLLHLFFFLWMNMPFDFTCSSIIALGFEFSKMKSPATLIFSASGPTGISIFALIIQLLKLSNLFIQAIKALNAWIYHYLKSPVTVIA